MVVPSFFVRVKRTKKLVRIRYSWPFFKSKLFDFVDECLIPSTIWWLLSFASRCCLCLLPSYAKSNMDKCSFLWLYHKKTKGLERCPSKHSSNFSGHGDTVTIAAQLFHFTFFGFVRHFYHFERFLTAKQGKVYSKLFPMFLIRIFKK